MKNAFILIFLTITMATSAQDTGWPQSKLYFQQQEKFLRAGDKFIIAGVSIASATYLLMKPNPGVTTPQMKGALYATSSIFILSGTIYIHKGKYKNLAKDL